MTELTPLTRNIYRLQRVALLVGAGASLLMLIGFFVDRDQFFRSYLVGYLYWLAPALGSLALVMLHNLTSGAWGFAIRRLLESAVRTLPFLAVLFLPILFGIHSLYEWSHADVVAHDPILQAKSGYLNTGFFVTRAVLFFEIWITLAMFEVRLTERYDRTLSERALRRVKLLSGFGLGLYVLTMSFASFDWGMSLEPHWFSTIYGIHFVVGQGLSTLCLATLVASRLARHEPFSRWLERSHFHDLGNLTMAFVMLWAYISFSQFLIIWSGNLPEETPWFLNRLDGAWQSIALILLIAHFVLPFLLLLNRKAKQNASILSKIAVAILLLRFLDFYWILAPAFQHGEFHPSWMDVCAPIALGGLWIWAFTRGLHGRPLVSLQDGNLLSKLEEGATS